MGLDLYIYKVSKPDLSLTQQYLEEDLKKKGCKFFTTGDMKENSVYHQLLPYSESLCVEMNGIDMDQIADTFQLIPDSLYPIVIGSIKTVIAGKKRGDGSPYSITLTNDVAKKFLVKKTVPCHVYQSDVVIWLHGHENEEQMDVLQNYMYEHFQIENCKYCKLSAEDAKEINKIMGAELLQEDLPADSAYFYLEWY